MKYAIIVMLMLLVGVESTNGGAVDPSGTGNDQRIWTWCRRNNGGHTPQERNICRPFMNN
jgi:hypothetical protein